MKLTGIFSSFIAFLFVSCSPGTMDPENQGTTNFSTYNSGFFILSGNSVLISHEEIELYDFSTHLIYLKEAVNFSETEINWDQGVVPFSVYALQEKVYEGIMIPPWSSLAPEGPFIDLMYFGSAVFLIRIDYHGFNDFDDPLPDPREDTRVIQALKKYNLYHQGISLKTDTVKIPERDQVHFTFTVNNLDTDHLYILSPVKMGLGLFHYFTNGFLLSSHPAGFLQQRGEVISPEPWDSWDKNWLDRLEAGESKTYTLDYQHFDSIPAGEYRTFFTFPGLSWIAKDEFRLEDGRIWLGSVSVEGTMQVE